jgi:trk system potassium uptake protein TrkH
MITTQILHLYANTEEAFRHAFFTVASLVSTTGYSTTDYWSGIQGTWPIFSLMILLFLMLCGACAGSTAGGLKQSRMLILGKYTGTKIKSMISPRSVEVIRLDGKPLDKKVVDSTVAFFVLYVMVILVCALLISIYNPLMEKDYATPTTMITASLSCISNIGPGLGAVGPAGGFSNFSWFSKLVLTFEMIAGRLELYPIFILFSRTTWKKGL